MLFSFRQSQEIDIEVNVTNVIQLIIRLLKALTDSFEDFVSIEYCRILLTFTRPSRANTQ